MLIDLPIQKGTKEAYELAAGLKQFTLDIKRALADGWQPTQDIPAFLAATITDLVPAVQGVDKLGAEEKENAEAFVTSFLIPSKELAFELLK